MQPHWHTLLPALTPGTDLWRSNSPRSHQAQSNSEENITNKMFKLFKSLIWFSKFTLEWKTLQGKRMTIALPGCWAGTVGGVRVGEGGGANLSGKGKP